MSNWKNPLTELVAGLQIYNQNTAPFSEKVTLEIPNNFGKVLVLYAQWNSTLTASFSVTCNWGFTFNSEFVNVISEDSKPAFQGAADQRVISWIENAYIFNAEVPSLELTWFDDFPFAKDRTAVFLGWDVWDSGTYALRRQMEVEKQLKALRGMTTGIDLSRPTQDRHSYAVGFGHGLDLGIQPLLR